MFKKIQFTIFITAIFLFSSVTVASASIQEGSTNGSAVHQIEQENHTEQQKSPAWFNDYFSKIFGPWSKGCKWYTWGHGNVEKQDQSYEQQQENKENVQEDESIYEDMNQGQQESEEIYEQNSSHQEDGSYNLSAYEEEVVQLTNEERQKHGLAPLQIDIELSQVAREKSKDMATNNYFDHQSPIYGSPFDMMKSYGITYQTAGENIAKGQSTPQEVVNAWMNSQGHRENILNGQFTHIGVGHVESGNHWTQMFIGK